MLGQTSDPTQGILFNDLSVLLNPKDPLYRLADRVPWSAIEARFSPLYATVGRPAHPIRLMVSLLMLKHILNLSDESVVTQWRQNPYMQYFSGMRQFQWGLPCDPSDLVLFRKRIGADGAEAILGFTIQMHGAKADAATVVVDTTVQEKAVAPPRDRRLYRKAAERVLSLARSEGVVLRRTFRRTIPKLMRQMITGNYPRAVKRARKAERTLRRIGLRLLRDLSSQLPVDRRHALGDQLALLYRVLNQRAGDAGKVFSLNEPQIYAIARGKDRAMYEFGSKVALAVSARSGVIVGAMNLAKNCYDAHTLPDALEQIEALTGQRVETVIGDKGYRGSAGIDETAVVTPADLSAKLMSAARRRRLRRQIRRRSMIEPIIGHLKSDHRLCRNHLKGWLGDEINVLLAAAGWNLAKLLRRLLWLIARAVAFSRPERVPGPGIAGFGLSAVA